MVIERKLYTAEDMLTMKFEDEDTRVYELVRGELVSMPRPSILHGIVQTRIAARVSVFVDEHRIGFVTVESGYILERDPDTLRGPDIAFVRADRPVPEGFMSGGPDLAVEVVSPSNSANDIQEKVLEYLAAGTRLVWVVFPTLRTVNVTDPTGTRTLGPDDLLDGGDLLPGFSVRVGDLFPA